MTWRTKQMLQSQRKLMSEGINRLISKFIAAIMLSFILSPGRGEFAGGRYLEAKKVQPPFKTGHSLHPNQNKYETKFSCL